ncbi:unnamed protein product [Linum trigynum]
MNGDGRRMNQSMAVNIGNSIAIQPLGNRAPASLYPEADLRVRVGDPTRGVGHKYRPHSEKHPLLVVIVSPNCGFSGGGGGDGTFTGSVCGGDVHGVSLVL